ncbi:MAG TPA: ribosome recycling factor [Patescibacteria group bacterium]|nr:ribosome recycling factor [Patescibacteria group bacterium]
MEDIQKITKEKLEKAKEFFENEIQNVRTGRANAMLVEDIKIEIYGSSMRIKDCASITVPDAVSILIIPWDKGNLKAIENAIQAQNLGVGVVNMGENIRVTLPELSAERRGELIKMVAKKSEETKIAMRNVRRESIDEVKKAEKNKEIGEDMVERLEKEVQQILDKAIAELDAIVEQKNKEISA